MKREKRIIGVNSFLEVKSGKEVKVSERKPRSQKAKLKKQVNWNIREERRCKKDA